MAEEHHRLLASVLRIRGRDRDTAAYGSVCQNEAQNRWCDYQDRVPLDMPLPPGPTEGDAKDHRQGGMRADRLMSPCTPRPSRGRTPPIAATLRRSRLDEFAGAVIAFSKLHFVPPREAAGELGATPHAEPAIDPTEMELDSVDAQIELSTNLLGT